jgi:hypothetical protein
MSIRSNASTVLMIVSKTPQIVNVVKGYRTKKFPNNLQELQWRTGVQGNNGVHAITQTSTQRTDRPVQHVCMSCLRVVEIGYTRDQ